MKIKLKTVGILGDAIRDETFSCVADEWKLGDFFRLLMERYGDLIQEHLMPGGRHYRHYAILVNGVNIHRLGEMETVLRDGDQIAVLTMVTGG